MKKFSKFVSLILLTFLLCSMLLLTGCNKSDSNDAPNDTDGASQAPTQDGEEVPSEPTVIESEGLEYRVNSDKKTCVITGIGTCKDEHLYIPLKIDGYEVTEIAESAFSNCSQLISATVPNHVKKIGRWAFHQCNNLTTLSIPFVGADMGSQNAINFEYIFGATGSNQSIDERDHAPESLKNVTVTGSVFIYRDAFSQCRNITSITLSGNIIEIHDGAFKSCSGLTELVLPDTVKEIGSQAFLGCTKLTQLKLPSSLTTLGNEAFKSCSRLTSIILPDSLTAISPNTFENCKRLESIVISKSVTTFGMSAFKQCEALKSFFYCGNAEQWSAIEKNDATDILSSATVYYYSETTPTTSGNYWRYVNGVPTVWS